MSFFKNHFILFLVVILAVFLRFYQLDNAKHGFYLDEAAIGYNAYSILQTGKDEFGKPFPLLFRSFTDFKAPFYIYLSVIPIKALGLNIFSTRFLSAMTGSLAVIFVYLILSLILNNKKYLPLLGALIFAVSPWQVFYSRGAWESNLSLFLLLAGTYFCALSLSVKKKGLFLLGAVFFVLSAYAYHGQRIVAPFILGAYLISFRQWILAKSKFLLLSFITLTLITLPILAISLTPGGQSRAKSLGFFSKEASLPWPNLNSAPINRNFVVARKWLALYAAYYTPRSLFSPDAVEKQRWMVDLATFYPWQFLFFIVGLIGFTQKKEYGNTRQIILPWLFFSPIAASLTGDPFSTVRALPLVFPICVTIAIGIYETILFVRPKIFKIALSGVLMIITFLSLVNLIAQLFYLLPYQRPGYWEIGYDKLVQDLLLYPNQKIVIDNSRGEKYIHVLFFAKFDPAVFQKETGFKELTNYYSSFIRNSEKKFGQFEYRTIDWDKEVREGNIIVGDELTFSAKTITDNPKLELREEIYYPNDKVAFRIIEALKEKK